MTRKTSISSPATGERGEPFLSAEEAWFWFITVQAMRNDGAQIAGAGALPRPCTPDDILNVLNRLYRSRRLIMDHLLVLRHYGRRQMAPDPRRVKEVRAFHLWQQALERLEPLLVRRGIVRPRLRVLTTPHKYWPHAATVHNGSGEAWRYE
jgi:hypothetical protein